jgi:hypothetical protein
MCRGSLLSSYALSNNIRTNERVWALEAAQLLAATEAVLLLLVLLLLLALMLSVSPTWAPKGLACICIFH